MSKINATYSSGYYISPDMDYRALEDQRSMQRKRERREMELARRRKRTKKAAEEDEGEEDEGEEDAPSGSGAIRQTFALPFDTYCSHCDKRMARGTHVYTNRRATKKKFRNTIRIWSLEIRCKYCHKSFFLETDPETAKLTGGYTCVKDCRRADGDFAALNDKNKEVREAWEAAQRLKEESPLEALERENEVARRLAEENRRIQEDVLARELDESTAGEGILQALVAEKNAQEQRRANLPAGGTTGPTQRHSLAQLVRGFGGALKTVLPPTTDGEASADDEALRLVIGDGPDQVILTPEEAAAEEAAYQQFEAERLLEEKRAEQQRKERAGSIIDAEDELSSRGVAWQRLRSAEDERLVREADERYMARSRPPPGMNANAKGEALRPSEMLFGAPSRRPDGATTGANKFLVRIDDDDDDDDDD